VSAATAAQMTQMMQMVVQKGSGWTSRIRGFELDQAGKTGTSQIPVNGQYTQDVWTSFVGFLPAQHPRFTMLVVVRKPNYPGSAAVVVDHKTHVPSGIVEVVVPDTSQALFSLASHALRRVQPLVVGVTGSNGKTSTKEMVAAVLGRHFNVLRTQGKLNTETG